MRVKNDFQSPNTFKAFSVSGIDMLAVSSSNIVLIPCYQGREEGGLMRRIETNGKCKLIGELFKNKTEELSPTSQHNLRWTNTTLTII